MYADEENEEDFGNPNTLSWENYTSYDEINPDVKITTCFIYLNHKLEDEILLNRCKEWFENNEYSTNLTIYESCDGWHVLEILKNGKKYALIYNYIDCLVIRYSVEVESILPNFLTNNEFFKLNFFVKVPHIEKEEKINDFLIKYRTGIFDNDSELLPRTFFQLIKNGQLIGKALMEYFEVEFGKTGSTLLMFEIEEDYRGMGLGELLLKFIENKMKKYGFDILCLSDTRSMNFWKKMGYEIDIDEGHKKL